jgi:hypothetical protein
VDREVIETIRKNLNKHKAWFNLKLLRERKDRDRMENEELYTSLVYLEYQRVKSKDAEKYLYIYDKNDGISVRMGSSHDITKLLQNVSEDDEVKSSFLKGIKNVESFLNKVKLVLLDRNVEGGREETDKFFNNELTLLFRAQRQIRAFKRTKQDFYILWYLISPINLEMIKFFRLQIKQDLHEIFYKLKNNLTEFTKEDFVSISKDFHLRYSIENRQTRLSETQKNIMIKEQANSCPISEAPLFIGDDIEVDHTIPISLGGKDSIDNLQITHKDSNRKKGSKNSF